MFSREPLVSAFSNALARGSRLNFLLYLLGLLLFTLAFKVCT